MNSLRSDLEKFRATGITLLNDLRVLCFFAENPGPVTQLIHSGVVSSHAAANLAIGRLLKAGLVHRERGTQDKRERHITLTPAGIELVS